MFDLGFWELCLIAVVALLVFGPEKLPGIARSAGQWVGRIRRYITTVKQEVDRELQLQEIRDTIQQSDQNSLHEFIEETKTGLNDLNKPINLDPTQEHKPDLPNSNIPDLQNTPTPDISQKTETR